MRALFRAHLYPERAVSFEELVESKIQDALAAGAFDGLAGAGKPLCFDPSDDIAGADWLGFKILRNGDMLPAWLMLAREIERESEALEQTGQRFREWVDLAAASDAWRRNAPAIRNLCASFEARARALRRRQDQFNFEAPTLALERPGIWVERRLARLDQYLVDAGAPDWLVTSA